MPDVLRIGVMLDGELVPAWIARLVADLAASPEFELVLVLTPASHADTALEDVGDWDGGGRSLGWSAWRAIERALFPDVASCFAATPLPESIRGVTRLTIPADARAAAAPLSMLKYLGQQSLDVMLQLGVSDWGVPLCGVARYGVWRLRPGGARRARRGAPAFWEVVRDEGSCSVCVEQLLPEHIDGRVLAEGAFTSNDCSVLRARAASLDAGARLLRRELHALQRLGSDDWSARVDRALGGRVPEGDSAGVVPVLPLAMLLMLGVYARYLWRKARALLTNEQWLLAYSFASRDRPDTRFERFVRITPPKDRIWADPFVVHRRGRWWVFFEEMLRSEQRGVLSCFELRADGGHTEPRRVLERPYHLSYPNVFEYGGEWYLLPETHEARRVELYRAVEFPWRWEPVRALLEDVELVDATLCNDGDRWWLFGTTRTNEHTTLQDALCLYSTDDLLRGEWTPHVDNPVVVDATSARPAGRIWVEDGRLMRPSQDCTYRYGYGLRINAIERLDDGGFREVCIRRVEPNWARDLLGIHTITFAGGLTVIDLLRRHPR